MVFQWFSSLATSKKQVLATHLICFAGAATLRGTAVVAGVMVAFSRHRIWMRMNETMRSNDDDDDGGDDDEISYMFHDIGSYSNCSMNLLWVMCFLWDQDP